MESDEEGSRKRKRTNRVLDFDSENGKTISRLGNSFLASSYFVVLSSKILIERLQLVMKVTVQTLIQRSPAKPSKVYMSLPKPPEFPLTQRDLVAQRKSRFFCCVLAISGHASRCF